MDATNNTILKFFLISVPVGIVIALVLIAFLSDHLFPGFEPFKHPILNGEKDDISPEDAIHLVRLLENGVVISPTDLIQSVSAFYTLVIQVLIAILGMLGVAAFFSIRSLSNDYAKQIAKESVDNALEHISFQSSVETKIEEKVAPSLKEFKELNSSADSRIQEMQDIKVGLESLGKLSSEVIEIGESVEIIAAKVADLDNTEDDVSGIIVPHRGEG